MSRFRVARRAEKRYCTRAMTLRRVFAFTLLCSLTSLTSALSGACGSEPDAADDGGSTTPTPTPDATPAKDAATPKDAASDGAPADAAKPDTSVADAADGAAPWPDCLTRPASAPITAIDAVWTANASAPAQVWLAGVHVTAVSRGGCAAGQACQIYVQEGTSYASLTEGAHKAIKVFASGAVASGFAGIAVGDRVDVLGWGWRYNLGGQSEILLQVAPTLPGCMRKIGTATVAPIAKVPLSALTRASYEVYGPLLVQVPAISGKPTGAATETFGLYPTGFDGSFPDAGTDIVSLSPFFLPGATFTNPPVVPGSVNAFTAVTGVFGTFTPFVEAGAATTYLELYARTAADIGK